METAIAVVISLAVGYIVGRIGLSTIKTDIVSLKNDITNLKAKPVAPVTTPTTPVAPVADPVVG